MPAQLTIGERVVRISGAVGVGRVVKIIPGHMDKYPRVRWVDAKAVVEWPAPRRIGGCGVMRTTVALSSLARPDEMGTCAKCGRHRQIVNDGQCGTCVHREERRINTAEMYGHGRRGY